MMDPSIETDHTSPTQSTIKTQVQRSIQTKSHSLMTMERWTEDQPELGYEIDAAPVSGIVPPNILVRIEIPANLIQPSSIIFPAMTTANENTEMVCEIQSIGKQIGE